MSQVPLAPPPPTGGPLDGWLYLLWRRLTQAGQVLWGSLDFSGSNLTDLETRNHADLQNIDTATYTHLTATQATDLTDGGDSTLHYHASDRALANTTGLGTGVGTALAINIGTAGAPVVNGGALGIPSSGTVTNLTGTASININGTVGATTPASVAATTLSATGVTTVQAGTALLPAIIPSGDPNTGVWFPAADTVAVSTGGTERMRIDSAGTVKIGTVVSSVRAALNDTSSRGNLQFSDPYDATGRTVSVGNNVYLTASSTWAYSSSVIGGSAITLSAQNGSPGEIAFFTAQDPDVASTVTERMRIDSAGNVGIGGAATAQQKLRIAGTYPGGTGYSFPVDLEGVIDPSVASTAAYMVYSHPTVSAGTLPDLRHFSASPGAFTGTVTTQYGFIATSTLTGATNNYGFYGGIASGTGRWNFYAAGSANNAYAGNSSFGQVVAPIAAVDTTSFATNIVTNTGATYTVLTTDHTIIQTTAASVYTLPAASSFTGRILHLVTQFAGTVTSASSNVVPIAGGAAGTAILAATAGKFATLQSNGTSWIIIASN